MGRYKPKAKRIVSPVVPVEEKISEIVKSHPIPTLKTALVSDITLFEKRGGGAELLPGIPYKDNKDVIEALREKELKEVNLTRKKAFRAVAEALLATIIDKFGNDTGEPDHKTRLQASKDALEILRDNAGAVVQKCPTINLFTSGGVRIG